jgi:DNA-binding NarL/FixJ family response regulator
MTAIRVLLAEDHELVRQGVRMLLEGESDIEVIGEASNGVTAVRDCQRLQPNVVILDISMPGMDGLAAARAIRASSPGVSVLALTRHDDEAFVHELMAAGAGGYVLKQSGSVELLNAVRAIATGTSYVDSSFARRNTAARGRRDLKASDQQARLSERERDVLRMMAVGHSNKDIAAELEISIKTVEVHKANGMRKLELRNRVDVVKWAILHGWLREP